MFQAEPAPLIVTLPVTGPVWPLFAATTLWPVVERVPPFVIVNVPVVLAPGVPKPACSVPTPTVSDPRPLTEPPLIASVPVEPAALPMVLFGHASGDEQTTFPPLETVMVPVPQLPMSRPLNAPPPVRLRMLPAPVTLTTPVPKPPMPRASWAAVRELPPFTVSVPKVPTPLVVKPRKMRWPVRSTVGADTMTGETSPDVTT